MGVQHLMLTEVKKREAEDLPKAGQVDKIFVKANINSRNHDIRSYLELQYLSSIHEWTSPAPGTRLEKDTGNRNQLWKTSCPHPVCMHPISTMHIFLPRQQTSLRKEKESWMWWNFHPKEIQFPFTVTLRFCVNHWKLRLVVEVCSA